MNIDGILAGLLKLASTSYLVAISKREQVAQIRGKPIYVITDVALIPLASQTEAQNAIQQARQTSPKEKIESLESGASDDEEDNNSSSGTFSPDDEQDDNASVTSATTTEHLEVPKRGTTPVADVIKSKGQYGRFAQRWFSKGGWKADGLRKQGISSEENLALTPEQKKQAEEFLPEDKKDEPENAPLEQQPQQQDQADTTTTETSPSSGETALNNLIPRILKTTKLYFTSRSFYFSYDYDISRSLSRQEPEKSSVALYKRFDPLVC